MTYEIEGLTGAEHAEFFGSEWYKDEDEEEIREITWNLCKEYDLQNKRRAKVLLSNFVSAELERRLGEEIENLFRSDWLEEVRLFCEKYDYAT